jgi:hypothetical protein
MSMENLYRHLHITPDLAVEFMVLFSRAEYALKSTQYAIGDVGRVDPAWDRFANDIHADFVAIADKSVSEASDYLLNHPPRKQVLEGEKIGFRDQAIDYQQKSTQQLLKMIRTIRNNLFHGGKYLPLGEHEAGRNQKLIESSLIVLKVCINLHQEVRASYEQ